MCSLNIPDFAYHGSLYEEQSLRMVWRVGPVPSAVSPLQSGGIGGDGGGASTPYLSALGDTAVDFDIAPPRAVPTPTPAADTSATAGGKDITNSSTITVRIRKSTSPLSPALCQPMG